MSEEEFVPPWWSEIPPELVPAFEAYRVQFIDACMLSYAEGAKACASAMQGAMLAIGLPEIAEIINGSYEIIEKVTQKMMDDRKGL